MSSVFLDLQVNDENRYIGKLVPDSITYLLDDTKTQLCIHLHTHTLSLSLSVFSFLCVSLTRLINPHPPTVT